MFVEVEHVNSASEPLTNCGNSKFDHSVYCMYNVNVCPPTLLKIVNICLDHLLTDSMFIFDEMKLVFFKPGSSFIQGCIKKQMLYSRTLPRVPQL